MQPISKSGNYHQKITDDRNESNHDDAPVETSNEDKTRKVIIIGYTMLNNINSRGLSKSKEVKVLNYPGATSSNIDTPESLMVHVDTNVLRNDINLLNNIKKIVTKSRKKSPNTIQRFSNIIIRKNKKCLEKIHYSGHMKKIACLTILLFRIHMLKRFLRILVSVLIIN